MLATAIAVCLFAALAPAGALALGPLSSFGSFGSAAGQWEGPEGIAVAADGTTYVSSFGSERVDAFSASGRFLFAFGHGVNATTGGDVCDAASGCQAAVSDQSGPAGVFGAPTGIAIGPDGLLYVADAEFERVNVFTAAGAFVRAFGKEVNPLNGSDVCTSVCVAGKASHAAGALESPQGLDFGDDGLLYVVDQANERVDVFTAAGTFVRAFGKGVNSRDGSDVCNTLSGCQSGSTLGRAAGTVVGAGGIAVSPGGLVAVSEKGGERINVFTTGGVFLRSFGRDVNPAGGNVCSTVCQGGANGEAADELASPKGLAMSAGGNLLVAEENNERVSEYGFDGNFIRAFGTGVVDGAGAFEVCTPASGCRAGTQGTDSGELTGASQLGVDCRGTVYVAEEIRNFTRIERIGEQGTAPAPCTSAPPVDSKPPAAKPSNRFRFGKLVLNRKRGTATLLVTVPGPGALKLAGRGIRTVKRTAKHAGAVKLAIRLAGTAKRRLRATGRARVRAKVTFKPSGGRALTRSKSLTLRRVR